MANTYLNKNVKFKCRNGNAVWFNPQNGDRKVYINGTEALLDDCRLCLIGGVRPGQCNLFPDPSTGMPSPCIAVSLSGSWKNHVNIKVGGKGILLSNCSIMCPRNGSIGVFKPTTLSLNVGDNAKEQTVSIVLGSNSSTGSPEADTRPQDDTRDEYGEQTEAFQENGDAAADERIPEEERYALCDYSNCERAKDCEYLKTPHTLKETNEAKNAAELKNNMGRDAFDLYAGECREIANLCYGTDIYSVAHHHIIPANQCFKSFAEIVKLANYYGYDINKAENGICLPTMGEGYDKQEFALRKDIAFYAMEVLGRQWHKGGHQYSCKIGAGIDNILPKPFLHYKDAVDQELIYFREKLNKEIKCRADNYRQQADEFAKIMDHISARIAKKLRHFENNPQKSFPCYISKLAFYYAFQERLSEYEEELFKQEG